MATTELRRTVRELPGRKPSAFITKALTCAAFIVLFWASAAAAGADPNPGGDNPNPFGGLGCSCAQAPAGSPGHRKQLIEGMQQGLAVGQREPNIASSPAKPPE